MSPIESLCAEVDSLLANKVMEDTMTEEEVKVMRRQTAVEVTVHGQTKQDFSIETLAGGARQEEDRGAQHRHPPPQGQERLPPGRHPPGGHGGPHGGVQQDL